MSFRSYIETQFQKLKQSPKIVRITIGILLVCGGILGVLPVVGFWMLPLGLILLAVDFPWARKLLIKLRLTWRRLRQRFSNSKTPANPT